MEDKLLTTQEVAERLHIHLNTLYNYIKRGEIPIVRLATNKRFIKEEDLEKFIREHTGIYRG